jgi:hypothetical protein
MRIETISSAFIRAVGRLAILKEIVGLETYLEHYIRSVSDKPFINTKNTLGGAVGCTAEANLNIFKDTYSDTGDLHSRCGFAFGLPSALYVNRTATSLQTRRIGVGRVMWRLGELALRA